MLARGALIVLLCTVSNRSVDAEARRRPSPRTKLGTPTVEGDLDSAIIRAYLRHNLMRLQHCYEKQLVSNAKAEGTIITEFTIDTIGRVSDPKASGMPKVDGCIVGVIGSIQFPRPKGDGIVKVTCPLTFLRRGTIWTAYCAGTRRTSWLYPTLERCRPGQGPEEVVYWLQSE